MSDKRPDNWGSQTNSDPWKKNNGQQAAGWTDMLNSVGNSEHGYETDAMQEPENDFRGGNDFKKNNIQENNFHEETFPDQPEVDEIVGSKSDYTPDTSFGTDIPHSKRRNSAFRPINIPEEDYENVYSDDFSEAATPPPPEYTGEFTGNIPQDGFNRNSSYGNTSSFDRGYTGNVPQGGFDRGYGNTSSFDRGYTGNVPQGGFDRSYGNTSSFDRGYTGDVPQGGFDSGYGNTSSFDRGYTGNVPQGGFDRGYGNTSSFDRGYTGNVPQGNYNNNFSNNNRNTTPPPTAANWAESRKYRAEKNIVDEAANKEKVVSKKNFTIFLSVAAGIVAVMLLLVLTFGFHIWGNHDWVAATCTSAKYCKGCHKIVGEPLGHDWAKADCTNPRTCKRCGETTGEPVGHKWKEGSCLDPRTCSVCGTQDGQPLGHDWVNKDCRKPLVCSRCGEESENIGKHSWKDATCTEPQTCKECGKTKGEKLGHDWEAANCQQPKTCKRCGKTSGDIGDHVWKAATLSAPKTCTICGETEGSKLNYSSLGLGIVNTNDGDGLNLRATTKDDASKVKFMAETLGVNIYDCNKAGWYYVDYNGTYGYVKSEYIALIGSSSTISRVTSVNLDSDPAFEIIIDYSSGTRKLYNKGSSTSDYSGYKLVRDNHTKRVFLYNSARGTTYPSFNFDSFPYTSQLEDLSGSSDGQWLSFVKTINGTGIGSSVNVSYCHRYGTINSTGVSGYSTNYVVDGGASSKIKDDVGKNWYVELVNTCTSHGVTWYECYDAANGDYYGWVDGKFIDFDDTSSNSSQDPLPSEDFYIYDGG